MSTDYHDRKIAARLTILTILLLGASLPFLQVVNASASDSYVDVPTMPKIAYLHKIGWGTGDAHETVLEPFGFDIILVNQSEIMATNLDTFDLIMIDGVPYLTSEQKNKIGNSSVDVVALGNSVVPIMVDLGGPEVTDFVGLLSGSQELVVANTSHPIFNEPNILPTTFNVTISVRTNTYLETSYTGTDMEFLAHDSNSQFYGLYRWTAPSGQKYTVFAFDDDPSSLFTEQGIQLLENIIFNSLPDSETPTPNIREIAFVYTSEPVGLDFQAFFESHNNSVDLIYKTLASDWNFNEYDVIVIGPGSDLDWAGFTSNINGSGKPVLSLGKEGLMFIDEIGGPGRLSTATMYWENIYVNETAHPIFNVPYSLPINMTYTNVDNQRMEGIYGPNLPYGTLLAGWYPNSPHFPIYEWGEDGQQFLIFGMNSTASELTDHGKQLYINALQYMAPQYADADDGDDSIIDQILDTLTDPDNLPGIGTASGLAMLIGLIMGIIGSKGKKKGGK